MNTSQLLVMTACFVFSCRSQARAGASFVQRAFIARGGGCTRSNSISSSLASVLEDYNELPQDYPRRDDVLVALSAVRKACAVTQKLQPHSLLEKNGNDQITTVTKADLSPVTLGDYSAQAVVLQHLHKAFIGDSFIAEESSAALVDDAELAQQVLNATGFESIDDVMESIDLGKSYETWDEPGSNGRPSRVWTLDPIDGTKGFLRGKQAGGQYCVALALIDDGVPTIGILGCPNLPASAADVNYAWDDAETEDNNRETRGCIFVASQGGGCFQVPLVPGGLPGKRVTVTPSNESTVKVDDARFCIGVEKSFGDPLGQTPLMAKIIHGENALDDNGEIIKSCRIDSQAKYGVLARGGGEFYVRLPKPGYREWIWDQAAGCTVIQEAGGEMTDVDGNAIHFGLGAKLSEKVRGVLGSNGGKFHKALLGAYQRQESARREK